MAKNEVINFGKIADIALADVPALDGLNPGMEPVEYNLIIAPATAPERVGKNSLILLADESKERMGLAAQIGRIVAASPLAFSYDAWPEGSRKPQVGDVVWFARYAGGLFEGADGREYRIIKDKDIGAVISRAFKAATATYDPNADFRGSGIAAMNAVGIENPDQYLRKPSHTVVT